MSSPRCQWCNAVVPFGLKDCGSKLCPGPNARLSSMQSDPFGFKMLWPGHASESAPTDHQLDDLLGKVDRLEDETRIIRSDVKDLISLISLLRDQLASRLAVGSSSQSTSSDATSPSDATDGGPAPAENTR